MKISEMTPYQKEWYERVLQSNLSAGETYDKAAKIAQNALKLFEGYGDEMFKPKEKDSVKECGKSETMKMSEMNESEKKTYETVFQNKINNGSTYDQASKEAKEVVYQFRKIDKEKLADYEQPKKKTKDAEDFLERSQELLSERGKQRDNEATGERSVGRAVRAFWALYGDSILDRGYMEEWEGWEFMSILKKSRKAYGKYVEDDYLDDVSYCALSGEAASEKDQ